MNSRAKIATSFAVCVVSAIVFIIASNISRQRSPRPNALAEVAVSAEKMQQAKAAPLTKRVEEKRMEGVELSAHLEKPSKKFFDSLEPITVVLTLKNHRQRSIEFTETASLRDFDFRAHDSYGNQIPATRYGHKSPGEALASSATRRTSLQHSDTMRFTFAVNRAVDMSTDGTYFVTVRRSFSSDQKSGYAESNAVRIVVASDSAAVGTIVRARK